MAITFVGSTIRPESGTAFDITLDLPAGVQDGDLLVAAVGLRRPYNDPWVVFPAGWTVLAHVGPLSGGTVNGDIGLAVAYKIANSEPASYLIDETYVYPTAAILAYRGAEVSAHGTATDPYNANNLDDHGSVSVTLPDAVTDAVVLNLVGDGYHVDSGTATADGTSRVRVDALAVQEHTAVSAPAGAYQSPPWSHANTNHAAASLALVLTPAAAPAPEVSITATLPALQAALTVDAHPAPREVVLNATLPALTGALTVEAPPTTIDVTLNATLPALTGALTVETGEAPPPPVSSDPKNEQNAIVFTTGGYVTQNPPVADPPPSLRRGHAKLKALAYTAPTVTNGRTVLEPDIAEIDAARDRIIVGGRDVTYFRDAPTPFPGFRLTQPLGYGATTLVFPQTHAAFETPGQGALRWLAKEKNVRIERIDPVTKERVGLDYRGVITALRVQQISLEGGESKLCWVADVGGAVSGRAALMEEQPPLFRRVRDVSRHVYWQMFQLRQRLPLPADTGIEIERQGGLSSLDWLHHLCAISTRKNGNQFTLMPDETDPVKWTWALKRKVRRDATVYFDSGMVVPDLVDDLAEQPNMIYGTGVTPDGMKVKNGSYPGLIQAKAPAYPFTDDRTFGMGDVLTDARPGSIQAMNWRLLGAGYMSPRAAEIVEAREMGEYTQETADAVDLLLEDGGLLPVDGRMTPIAWQMLFDLAITGYSLRQTNVLPMAQAGYTRAWNRTASGAKASRNPAFRPHRLKVHRTIDFGSGHRKQRMMQWARGELHQAQDGQNWVGTITVNTGALVRGDHTPGTPLTAADVMPFRDLRPGMNVWAPLFDGGTLFHVAGIDVSDDGRTGTLTVDTKFRDLMSVAEVVARNRESRRDPARAWHREHRKSKLTWDTIVPFDEVGGRIWQPIDCPAYEWTVFPVVAGQEGTIAKLRLDTTQGPAEFAMTVWGRKPFKRNLDKYLSDPMALDEDGRSVWEEDRVMFRKRILLYAAGTDEEPCGYWPKRHTDRNGNTTLHPITGRWVDDATFSYHTHTHPVLWVAIWPKQGTLIEPQRILWPQLEVGG